MFIDREGNEVDAVYVPDGKQLFECWRVRVIRDEYNAQGKRTKRVVVGEEDFQNYPSKGQRLYCIAKYQGDFCSVSQISAIDWLPFTEETEQHMCPTAIDFENLEY